MSRLWRTVPWMAREAPPSFASRLAAGYGTDAAGFCADMGLSLQSVAGGDAATLHSLADLAGCDPAALAGHALVRQEDRYSIRGQVMPKSFLRRAALRVCPACLAADVSGSALPPIQAAYVRTEWLLDPIRTCSGHRVALVPTVRDHPKGTGIHDYAARLSPMLSGIDASVRAAPRRDPSALETYLLARLGEGRGGSEWLDALPFHAAARACEVVGAVRIRGRSVRWSDFGDGDWHSAGGRGFEVLDRGTEGFRAFLAELQSDYDHTGPEGPQAVFGRIYTWAGFTATHPDFDGIRDVIRRHVLETMPVDPATW